MPDPLYVIGDVHGQIDLLQSALTRIAADGGQDARIIFLGDYTDRGPKSSEVLDLLVTARAEGRNWTCLKGNHDRMFEWFLDETPRFDPHLFVDLQWLHPRLGGLETLGSYGIDVTSRRRLGDLHDETRAAVPSSHIGFLRSLALTYQTDDHFFTHAGILPEVPLDKQMENDLLWIREPFLQYAHAHPKMIVHGHSALDYPEHAGNRVNLDGGAGYGRPIYPAVFEGTACWLLTSSGRQPLRP